MVYKFESFYERNNIDHISRHVITRIKEPKCLVTEIYWSKLNLKNSNLMNAEKDLKFINV